MRNVIIYNNHRPEKYDLFVAELEGQRIDYEIFHCEKNQNRNTVESISESFKTVIREAKERGDNEILIMEDDIMFTHENAFEYFIKNKPERFDCYLGGSYFFDNRISHKAPVTRINEWTGNQCILINETYYDTWLSSDSKLHCDCAQRGLGIFYLCFPIIALQRNGWSSNTGAIVNYNSEKVLPPEYIYK